MENEKLSLAFHLEQQKHPFAFLYDTIYSILQRAIISGSFMPGSVIKVKEVALMLNVSPTPAARAFSMLEKDGLLTPLNGTTYLVVGYTYHALRDIMNFRSMLEPSIAFQTARDASKEDIAELARLVRFFKKYSSDDTAKLITNISENEMTFIKKCCKICSSSYLREAFYQNQAAIYRSILFINTQMFEHPDTMRKKAASPHLFYENYSNILYAIKSRNGRMAMGAVYSHLRVIDIRNIQFSDGKSQKAFTYTDKK